MEQHVDMTEDLVEKLTPAKAEGAHEEEERNKILEGIAEVCMQQRQYHLATKKYTQAGNKLKVCVIGGLRCLGFEYFRNQLKLQLCFLYLAFCLYK